MAKSIYQRLTGRRRGFTGYSQLWLAPDHLLLVESGRFFERYRRFALADIQAIVVTELPEHTVWQVVALLAAMAWMLLWYAVDSTFGKYFFEVTGAMGVGFAIADIARGPRCRCYLVTAISRELLSPVSRMRGAQAFLDRIRPAIESVQGTLATESIRALPPSAAPADADFPPEVPAPAGYIPEALFALFLLNALLMLVGARFPRTDLGNVLLTTFFGEFVILVVALLRRRGHDSRRAIYALMAVALIFMGWDAVNLGRSFFEYMNSLMETTRRGKPAAPSLAAWIAFSQSKALFAASWRAVAGLLGLLLAWTERRAVQR